MQAESSSSGSLRYGMLETVRQYGAEKLSQIPGATGHLELRHGAWCLALAEEAEQHLMGMEQTAWLERLEDEHDNMRAALSALAPPPTLTANTTDSELESSALLGLRLAGTLHRFWRIRGYLSEGRENLERALQAQPAIPESRQSQEKGVRANALLALGSLALHQSDYAIARERLEQALALFREIEDTSGIANTLVNQGIVTFEQGDYKSARGYYEQALPLYREIGNTRGVAVTLSNLGVVASNQGEYALAREHYEQALTLQRAIGNKLDIAHLLENLGIITLEKGDYGVSREYNEQALALYREVGNKSGIGSVLTNLGNIAFDQSDYQTAQERHTQSLTLYREIGSKSSIATTRTNLGSVAVRLGDYAGAQEHYAQAMALSRASGNRRLLAYNLEGLADIARSEGMACDSERALKRLHTAVVLFAVAATLRESIGSPLSPVAQTQQAEQLAQMQATLGDEAFALAWAEATALPWEQVVEEALQDVSLME